MVPVDSRRIPRVPRYSGYCYVNRRFAYGAVTRYGRSFQNVLLTSILLQCGHTTPQLRRHNHGLSTSPKLIAAYHVLHRLREPRHPPYALSYFPYTVFLISSLRSVMMK